MVGEVEEEVENSSMAVDMHLQLEEQAVIGLRRECKVIGRT
jgi:hypothetical protein